MNVYVSQMYVEVGAVYPFSVHFQRYLGEELSKRVPSSDAFVSRYGIDFDLIFRMSAKSNISVAEIKGPTIFKKDKDIEFTIFLPFNKEGPLRPGVYRRALVQLMGQIAEVLIRLGLDVSQLTQDSDAIIDSILDNPKMFT